MAVSIQLTMVVDVLRLSSVYSFKRKKLSYWLKYACVADLASARGSLDKALLTHRKQLAR